MASFAFDQAEGLRRMAAGAKPRVFTFLSAATLEGKHGMLVNLAASLMRVGSDVMVVDACGAARGIANRLDDAQPAASLLEVARDERSLEQAVRAAPQGFQYASLTRGASFAIHEQGALNAVFMRLHQQADVMMVDAELDAQGTLPVTAMVEGEIVVQVTNHADSIKQAYLLVKQLHGQVGRRSFGVLVTGVSEKEAQRVYANLAQTASRYLAVELRLIGAVPDDEHMSRAVKLKRPVVEAFPLAAASVAFREIASWFAQQGRTPGKRESWSSQDAGLAMAGV